MSRYRLSHFCKVNWRFKYFSIHFITSWWKIHFEQTFGVCLHVVIVFCWHISTYPPTPYIPYMVYDSRPHTYGSHLAVPSGCFTEAVQFTTYKVNVLFTRKGVNPSCGYHPSQWSNDILSEPWLSIWMTYNSKSYVYSPIFGKVCCCDLGWFTKGIPISSFLYYHSKFPK